MLILECDFVQNVLLLQQSALIFEAKALNIKSSYTQKLLVETDDSLPCENSLLTLLMDLSIYRLINTTVLALYSVRSEKDCE
jgi:hypothetical protein